MLPRILGPRQSVDFHDSSLVDLRLSSSLKSIDVVLLTENAHGQEQLWRVRLSGVLSFDFEITGTGTESSYAPIEIYSVYEDTESREWRRWNDRLRDLDEPADAKHIVFASSFVRGWGEREERDGISVVCRHVLVEPAPAKYRLTGYSRPRIPAENDL